ncbi:MAG: hypothetical protein DWH91_19425 [Planctomycetota bacterium]|nr:MAG: hypothetical protein DWH91_19425 [Planctomycetota bacterium]
MIHRPWQHAIDSPADGHRTSSATDLPPGQIPVTRHDQHRAKQQRAEVSIINPLYCSPPGPGSTDPSKRVREKLLRTRRTD